MAFLLRTAVLAEADGFSAKSKEFLVTMYVKLARREEREVLVEFGEEYRRYMAGTPAFFPRAGTLMRKAEV